MEIELQPFERSDFSRLISWVSSPEFLLQWAGPIFHYPLTEDQLESYYSSGTEAPADRLVYKAIDRKSGEVVGHIELNLIDRENRSARLSRVLVGPDEKRNKGIGALMTNRILEIAFQENHLHRVDLFVFDFNIGAIQCYEKCGFKKEGFLRDARRFGDGYWSLYLMSILENEWRRKE